jgi:ABC-type sugar transport system ATPase subunit
MESVTLTYRSRAAVLRLVHQQFILLRNMSILQNTLLTELSTELAYPH